MADKTHRCPTCGKTIELMPGQPVPSCCGRTMESIPLPACTKAPTAEMARPGDADEPCDDGTGPKRKK